MFLESLVVVRDGDGLSEARIKPHLLLRLPKRLPSYCHGKETETEKSDPTPQSPRLRRRGSTSQCHLKQILMSETVFPRKNLHPTLCQISKIKTNLLGAKILPPIPARNLLHKYLHPPLACPLPRNCNNCIPKD